MVVSVKRLPSTQQAFLLKCTCNFCNKLNAWRKGKALIDTIGSSAAAPTHNHEPTRKVTGHSPKPSPAGKRQHRHCSLRSHLACGTAWPMLRSAFRSSGALKTPMTPRLSRRPRTSVPTVPAREAVAPWATKSARRDIMSVMTPSI